MSNLIEKRMIGGVYFKDKFIDIGTPNKLFFSNKFLKNFTINQQLF